jgi:hypothetical protein
LYTSKLIKEFDSLPDYSKKSIITTLWFSYSCEADVFLKEVKNNPQYSEDVRKYVSNLLGRNKVDSKTERIMKEIYGSDLDKIWFESFTRFSDEAIGNIDFVIRSRRQNEKCR